MQAELIGGPRDGQVIDVKTATRFIDFPYYRLPAMTVDAHLADTGPMFAKYSYRLSALKPHLKYEYVTQNATS